MVNNLHRSCNRRFTFGALNNSWLRSDCNLIDTVHYSVGVEDVFTFGAFDEHGQALTVPLQRTI